MSIENQKTIAVYNDGVEDYRNGTARVTSGSQKEWLDFVFDGVRSDAKILEIGSAFGRDARYLLVKGYDPDFTDASIGFVNFLRQNSIKADLLDIVQDRPKKVYDVILACAVFLHFTDEDFKKAIRNVRDALDNNGKFAFSVKLGEGEGWSNTKMGAPRYFNYYQPDELERKLTELGLIAVDSRSYDHKWLRIVATKNV